MNSRERFRRRTDEWIWSRVECPRAFPRCGLGLNPRGYANNIKMRVEFVINFLRLLRKQQSKFPSNLEWQTKTIL